MATIDLWIQLENRPWDACPWLPVNRMVSAGTTPVGPLRLATLRGPNGAVRQVAVNRPLEGDALILRRYTENWAQPADRKVNPWDLNEPDPTDAGTMGTIPGPTIECNVGDIVRVHFRNFDQRTVPAPPWGPAGVALPAAKRTHSLHAHGFTFPSKFDGAYPLTPPDPDQPIPIAERAAWSEAGVAGSYKQGDRVPPLCSFTYTWHANGPASAGVWFYHDHSICDENTTRGALGFIVIHNPADKANEVEITPARLPDGSWTGSPLVRKTQPLQGEFIGIRDRLPIHDGITLHPDPKSPVSRFGLESLVFEVSPITGILTGLSIGSYRNPPEQALYLLMFHELEGVGMCINGRQYLGNAPTLVAGAKTRMRFGIAGMGEAFHTFHIHGHRWVVLGPSGKTGAAIEQSIQAEPVTPFEDTKVFGPGTSFAFTLEEGSGLFRADPPFGEWHVHCHVPMHMMHGMAGSLLVIKGGELAFPLPEGRPCPPDPQPVVEQRAAKTFDVEITDDAYKPPRVWVLPGDSVRFMNNGRRSHDIHALDESWTTNWLYAGQSATVVFTKLGEHPYHCTLETGMPRPEDNHHHSSGPYPHPAVVVIPQEFGITGDPSSGSTPAPATPTPAAPAGGGATVHDVTIDGTGFHPGSLSIKAGDSVRWTNQDSSPHTATADDHGWTTPMLTGGKSFSQVFTAKGPVNYHCHIHHEMTATLQVT